MTELDSRQGSVRALALRRFVRKPVSDIAFSGPQSFTASLATPEVSSRATRYGCYKVPLLSAPGCHRATSRLPAEEPAYGGPPHTSRRRRRRERSEIRFYFRLNACLPDPHIYSAFLSNVVGRR